MAFPTAADLTRLDSFFAAVRDMASAKDDSHVLEAQRSLPLQRAILAHLPPGYLSALVARGLALADVWSALAAGRALVDDDLKTADWVTPASDHPGIYLDLGHADSPGHDGLYAGSAFGKRPGKARSGLAFRCHDEHNNALYRKGKMYDHYESYDGDDDLHDYIICWALPWAEYELVLADVARLLRPFTDRVEDEYRLRLSLGWVLEAVTLLYLGLYYHPRLKPALIAHGVRTPLGPHPRLNSSLPIGGAAAGGFGHINGLSPAEMSAYRQRLAASVGLPPGSEINVYERLAIVDPPRYQRWRTRNLPTIAKVKAASDAWFAQWRKDQLLAWLAGTKQTVVMGTDDGRNVTRWLVITDHADTLAYADSRVFLPAWRHPDVKTLSLRLPYDSGIKPRTVITWTLIDPSGDFDFSQITLIGRYTVNGQPATVVINEATYIARNAVRKRRPPPKNVTDVEQFHRFCACLEFWT